MSSTPDASQPQGSPAPARGAGFLQALFDINFNTFVTPKIVKIVYVIGMVLIGLVTLGMILSAFSQFTGGYDKSPLLGLLMLVGAPLVGIIYLALFRMSLELYYAVIRLSEDVHNGPSRSI